MKPQTKKRFSPKFLIALLVVSLPFLYYLVPWDYRVPQPQQALPSPHVSPYCFATAQNADAALLGGNQDDAWLVEPSTGKVLHRFLTIFRKSSSVDLTPDGKTAAVCEADGTITLWNAEDGSKISSYSVYVPIDDLSVNDASIDRYRIALSPDASTFLVSDKLMGLRLMETRREKELRALIGDNDGEHRWFDFAPQGDAVYVFNDKTSSIEIHSLIGDASKFVEIEPISLQTALIAPDGERLFLAGKDGLIRVWDVASQKVVKRLRHSSSVTSLSVSADGSLLCAGGQYGNVTVWNLSRLQYVGMGCEGLEEISAVWIAPDHTELVAVERTGAMWNWNFKLQKTAWGIDGFQLNAQNQVVPKAPSAPKPDAEINPISNEDFQALLDRPIDWRVVFKDDPIEYVINFLSVQMDIAIKFLIVRSPDYHSGFFSFADWLMEAIAKTGRDCLILNDETIRIALPETLENYRESASDKTLHDIPELNAEAPLPATYINIEDIVRVIRSKINVDIIVEDDLYGKVTLELDSPTSRQLLEIALAPNGLDYSIHNGVLYIDDRDNAIDCLKTIVRSDPSIESSLDVMKGFTPSQWNEMERRSDRRLTPAELTALIVNYHSQFESTQIVYGGEDRSGEFVGDDKRFFQQPWVDTVKQVLQLRRDGAEKFAGRLRSKDSEIALDVFKSIPDERLETFIKEKERLQAGMVRKATRTYSVDARRRVLEVSMPEDDPHYHAYFLDDDNKGWLYAPRSEKPEENYLISRINRRPDHPYRFGADLDWHLLNGYRIAELDWTMRKLRVIPINNKFISFHRENPLCFEYTLLDGRNAYWKQCDSILNGRVIRRITCGDFVEISGMLIPQTVSVRDYRGTEFVSIIPFLADYRNSAMGSQCIEIRDGLSIGRFRYEYKMKLIDAKINEPINEIGMEFHPPYKYK